MSDTPQHPPGWYYAQGDPPGTNRYWDGTQWQGGPQPVPGSEGAFAPPGSTGVAESGVGNPWKRILARVVDVMVLIIPLALLSAIIGSQVLGSIVTGILTAAYEVLMVANRGGTVGKQVLGLKVVTDQRQSADLNVALRRTGLYIAFIFIGVLPIIGPLLFLFVLVAGLVMLWADSQGQTPWDKIGQTLVVER